MNVKSFNIFEEKPRGPWLLCCRSLIIIDQKKTAICIFTSYECLGLGKENQKEHAK